MTVSLLGRLAVLALIDSTSFGTLLIPIWLMLAPGRFRSKRLLIFLGTVAAFYFVLGLLLAAGISAFSEQLESAFATRPVQILQVFVGVVLVVTALLIPSKNKDASERGRITRWRELAMSEQGSTKALMGLALGAGIIEAASMIPYLAAIGLMGSADLNWPSTVGLLAVYCLMMILPALMLLGGRLLAASRIQPILEWINGWMVRNARENTAWIIGLVGFFIASTAARDVGWLGSLSLG